MQKLRLPVLVAMALALGCGAEPDRSLRRSTAQPLLLPSLTPVPCRSIAAGQTWAPPKDGKDAGLLWDGSVVDLLTADALVQCAAALKHPSHEAFIGPNNIDHDLHLRWVVQKMRDAVPDGTQSPGFDPKNSNKEQFRLTEQRWADIRARPEYNCDPVTHAPGRPVELNLTGGVNETLPAKDFTATIEDYSLVGLAAQSDLRTAGMNLCIAQYLRKASPGASSGASLLLDEADQRSLLETIRERAQIAMLQYALLGVVFTLKPVATEIKPLTNFKSHQVIPVLEWWANWCIPNQSNPGCKGNLTDMGRDFATAVQLHVIVTEELAELLARSSSAKTQRGGAPATRADDIWGPGSWKQRLEALLFGGDPLGIEKGGPWEHPLHFPGPTTSDGWPDAKRLPHFRSDILEPQVRKLFGLARHYDRLRFERDSFCSFDFKLDEGARTLYDSVEANLRKDTCAVVLANKTCETDLAKLAPKVNTPLTELELWKRHRITRAHADALVQHLAELLRFGDAPSGCAGTVNRNDSRVGPLNIVGTVSALGSAGSPGPIVIEPRTKFVEPPLQDVAPKYTRFAQLRIPDPAEVVYNADSGMQGFHGCTGASTEVCPAGWSLNSEAKRLMGAVSAQVAVRRALVSSLIYLNQELGAEKGRLNDYFAQQKEILALLSGATGDASFSLRPWVIEQPAGALVNLTVPVTVNGANELRNVWKIEGMIEKGDPFWDLASGQQQNVVCSVESPYAGNLAAQPFSSIHNFTIVDLLSNALAQVHCGWAGRDPASYDAWHAGPSRWTGYVPTRGPTAQSPTFRILPTLVAVRLDPFEIRLLGSQFATYASFSRVRQGQEIASGGHFGTFLRQQVEHHEWNPVQPRNDAFGLRTDWVPPLAAELIGGPPGEQSAAHYLNLAKSSATEATAAVEKAIDQLIAIEQDEVAEAASAAQSQAGIKEEKDALCGASESCLGIATVPMKPQETWYPSAPKKPQGYPDTCPAGPTTTAQASLAMECLVYEAFEKLLSVDVAVAQPVLDKIDAPAPPAFSEYSGGKLQSALIRQWEALKAPDEKLKSLVTAREAADAQMFVAEIALSNVEDKIAAKCGGLGLVKGLIRDFGDFASGDFFSGDDHAEACRELQGEFNLATWKVIAAQLDAIAGVSSALQGTLSSHVAIQLSSAEVDILVNDAELKTSRHQLEGKLASQSAKTSFGLSRRYRAYDLWRAKALVEGSRRYALAARRSIEARNVVNLSTLTQPEAFVSSPASWADEVYTYDLSLPAAVGLATGEKEPGGIYANKVKDYVANLEAFASGYAVSRPSAVSKEDIDVVTLPGLSSDSPIYMTANGTLCDGPGGDCVATYGDRGNWLLHCKSTGAWKPLNPSLPASQACGPACPACDAITSNRPDLARIEFALDPWGRVNGSIANEPYQKRFNGRWGSVALNIVGTGVKDCKQASDPLACYSQGFIPYGLTQVGPAWVTDYDEIWRLQSMPFGRIEGAKAIAAELWLDPLKDGWTTSYISAVRRSEFELRPLGGAYELEIALGPEVQVDRIERIQVLIGSSYWVKQQ